MKFETISKSIVPWLQSIKLSANSNMSLKKTLKASEQEREDIRKSREEWRTFQEQTDIARLVFLDESGVKTNMTRLYGRAYQGTRCYDAAPVGHWETVTVLSAIRLDGSTQGVVFEGAVVHAMLDEYIKQLLAPTLNSGDIVVLDNLKAHKSATSQATVTARQAEIKFLPAYSPDLNPIEKMWSKVKQTLRGMKPRTDDELFSSIGIALDMVTADDAQGWFKSCGYIVSQS